MSDAEEVTEEQKEGQKSSNSFIARNQHLFLAEFLIDTVNLDPQCFSDEVMEGQTCVTLNFLSFPPMVICEKDFDPGKEPGIDKIRFNSGKSLMFAFSEKQCEDPPPMMAEVLVGKKLGDDSGSDPVSLGRIKICMTHLFQQVYDTAKFTPEKLPASKSIKDCFMLIGRGKRTVGEVGIYVRLTCLGQNVVTEFQCGADMKQSPVLFKNKEGKKVYEFMGTDKNEDECEDDDKFNEGCGCLGPRPQGKHSGGQGDAGPGRRALMGATHTKSSRVVLDIPNKPNSGTGKQSRRKPTGCNCLEDGATADGSAVSPVNTDPDHNCFVLKVGDKGQIPDRGKMILEFRTPKQKIAPKVIPPYHEDIAVQTNGTKKRKGKGKGKK